MSNFSTGFTNGTVCANNINFDGNRTPQMTGDGQLIIGSSVSNPHIANLISSDSSVLITNGHGTIDLKVASVLDFTWQTVDSTSNTVQIAKFNVYVCTGSAQVNFVLPTTPALGDTFKIFSQTSQFQISENTSQSIRVGLRAATATTGTLTSNDLGTQITLSYTGNNIFQSEASEGTVTLT